jgi:hypothetical protein
LHERAEAPGRGGAENVQTRYRRFEPGFEAWVSIETIDLLHQLRREKVVLGDVYSIPSAENNVVNISLGAVV